MAISVTCPCGATYRLKPEAAGKTFPCRECDAMLAVPQPVHEPQPRTLRDDDFAEPAADEYEDYDEFVERPARESIELGSSSGRHNIVMTACETSLEAITPERLQHACDELLAYFEASPGVFKRADVRLAVRSKVKDANQAGVTVQMSGTINARPIQKKVEGACWNVSNEAALGMSQGVVGALVGAAIDRAKSRKGGPHRALQQEFVNLRYKLFGACDKAVGRKASKAGGRWKGFQIGALAAGPIAFLAFFAFAKIRGESALTALMSGAMVIVPAAFAVLAAGLIFMPDSFFLREAAGRRALRLSGASSPQAARIIGGVTAVLMLALAVGIVVMYLKMQK